MAFLSGIQVIHAPASALNNAGAGAQQTENKVEVKTLRMGGKRYPYISAQAWRYWLRTTLLQDPTWKASPTFREGKIAYTDANPIRYDDDDVFGYMRAPSKKADALAAREGISLTPIEGKGEGKIDALTRVAPLRVGTLVGLSSQMITSDFGTMSRHEGDPVPHEHEFYSGSLRGLFGLDLGRVGVFTAADRTGFLNLDEVRKTEAQKLGAESPDNGLTYILPEEVRWQRVATLLQAFPRIEGGAKQTLHATDVTPTVVVMAVFRGGINPFYPIVHPDESGHATLHVEGLFKLMEVWEEELLSPLYIGWASGYPPENPKTETTLKEKLQHPKIVWGHPREAFERLLKDLEAHPDWWVPVLPFRSDTPKKA